MKRQLLLICALGMIYSLQGQDCLNLIWEDDFNGNTLDTAKWNYDIGNGCPELCGWGNNEQQWYAQNNVSVGNGLLTITAKEEAMGGMDYTSGKVTTINKGDFRYGRIEASIRLPQTQGMWPAFWLLPTEKVYGEWPRSGEIDVMELLGQNPDSAFGTIHTGLPYSFTSGSYKLPAGETFADTFHVFAIEWSPDTISWFIDGNMYHQLNSDSVAPWEPFREDFHLILNIAVGGNLPGPADSTTVFPQSMEVDYVRVYNRPDRLNIFGKQPVEGQTNMTYRTFDVQGAAYNWMIPADANIVSGQGTNSIVVDWGCMPGNIEVELQTTCDTTVSTDTLVYEVGSFKGLEIAGPETVSSNQSGIRFQVPTIGGATYTWEVPTDATVTAGAGTNEITVDWGCSVDEVSVSITGSCGTTLVDTFTIISPSYAIAGFSIVPANTVGAIYSIGLVPGATYDWSVPSDATITSGQGTNEITVDLGSMGGEISVVVTTSCGFVTYTLPVSIDPSTLYCDFDGVDLEWGDFGGAAFEKVANPFPDQVNSSDSVGKTRKEPGAQTWGGVFADLGREMDLDVNSQINMKVYGELEGDVMVKIEDQTSGTPFVEIPLPFNTLNQWVNVIWDFSGQPTDTYDRIALFFNFGDRDTSYWYFDDIVGRADPSVSIDDEALTNPQVYPNPTTGSVQLQLNGLFDGASTFMLEVFDSQGRTILSETRSASQDLQEVQVGDQPEGIYFLRLSVPGMQYVKMLKKED